VPFRLPQLAGAGGPLRRCRLASGAGAGLSRHLRRRTGRDALNRRLGRLGEEFVALLERHRLRTVGRDDLAQKVQWVTATIGDGLGFDVLSFDDADGSEAYPCSSGWGPPCGAAKSAWTLPTRRCRGMAGHDPVVLVLRAG
jgi:hypothetical protein